QKVLPYPSQRCYVFLFFKIRTTRTQKNTNQGKSRYTEGEMPFSKGFEIKHLTKIAITKSLATLAPFT
ncbi:MAG: hypothetical protein ACJA1P_002014, partial [Maribacter sp.]